MNSDYTICEEIMLSGKSPFVAQPILPEFLRPRMFGASPC